MGPDHTLILTHDYKVYSCGTSTYGKLGRNLNEDGDIVYLPKLVRFYHEINETELTNLKIGAI